MGCINSRADINDYHPNIFQVMNVDDLGNLITPGRLEITDSDIVFYQSDKQSVKWPLRCLRRYGYDSEIFSFESGRRCLTGPGIYAFKCQRADQLFNLVQSNIQVCNSSADDTVSRDLSVASHAPPAIARMTVPSVEPNYLDPARSSSRVSSRFSHIQQNGIGRLGSVGSSSGPMSPQGTMGSPSPPPIIPSLGAQQSSIPQTAHCHPSALYINGQVLSAIAMEIESDNNNKSLRRTMQRSHTLSSTSSGGFIPEPVTVATAVNPETKKSHCRPPPLPNATYMNIDISSEQSPLSPCHVIANTVQLSRDEINKEAENNRRAYMNISPGVETGLETVNGKNRENPLTEPLSQRNTTSPMDCDETTRRCYANLERAEIEELRIRCSAGDGVSAKMEKTSPLQNPQSLPPFSPSLPALISPTGQQSATTISPPAGESIREVNYAILDLDKKNLSAVPSALTLENTTGALSSPPDSPNKPQKGYATIDFNKTAALSHSVNPNVVNDNEGSRKTRHNFSINGDSTAPTRHGSSVSECQL